MSLVSGKVPSGNLCVPVAGSLCSTCHGMSVLSHSSSYPGIVAFIKVYSFTFPTWSPRSTSHSWYWLASYTVCPISSSSAFCIARHVHNLFHFRHERGGGVFLWNVGTHLPDNTVPPGTCTVYDCYFVQQNYKTESGLLCVKTHVQSVIIFLNM
jgi:hypothetical protein